MEEKIGLVQIYTGDGKGKTTSSIGLTVRAIGRGFKVCYVFFFKNFSIYPTGELEILEKLGVKTFSFALDTPLFRPSVSRESVREGCLNALNFIKNELFVNEAPDLLVLDEINNAIPNAYLSDDEIIDLIKHKPVPMELVLTGRGASQKIMSAADLVSKIEKIKHPFDSGVPRRKGIEY
jgi:cob(I)alamin adenosyltransferase